VQLALISGKWKMYLENLSLGMIPAKKKLLKRLQQIL
jgi:hypothetical protein